jgi:hypothetical protein
MGKNTKMKMTHKAKSNPSKNQKSSNSKHLGSKNASKSSSKPAAKPASKVAKKEFEFKKKSSFAHSNKNAKPFKEKDKKTAPASFKGKVEVKKTGYSNVAPVKGHKKEIKIEVSSFKKEHLKKLEQKKREQEKNLELKNQKIKEDQNKHKKTTEKTTEKKTEVHAKSAAPVEPVKAKKVEVTKAPPVAKEKDKETKKQKAQKPKESEEELDDVFLSDDDGSEIEEYAEDLKAVEEADLEIDETVVFETETKEKNFEEINLTDAEGNLLCRARDCDQVANVDGYCRYHYLLYWKKIQVRKKILTEGKLDRYVDELTARYPDKFLEMIRRDLRTQKDFLSAIQELEIDESNLENDFEEDTQTFIDEVRGMNETSNIDEEFE